MCGVCCVPVWSPASLPLMCCTPITPASLIFLKHSRKAPTSGPLHLLFPLPGMLFTQKFGWNPFSFPSDLDLNRASSVRLSLATLIYIFNTHTTHTHHTLTHATHISHMNAHTMRFPLPFPLYFSPYQSAQSNILYVLLVPIVHCCIPRA